LNNAIYVKPSHSHLIEAEFYNQGLITYRLTISGGVLAYIFSLVMVEKMLTQVVGYANYI
jgi:hypothetical protein